MISIPVLTAKTSSLEAKYIIESPFLNLVSKPAYNLAVNTGMDTIFYQLDPTSAGMIIALTERLKSIKAGGKERIQKLKRDKLVNDAFSKKKKLKKNTAVEPCLTQPSLLGYITLHQDLH